MADDRQSADDTPAPVDGPSKQADEREGDADVTRAASVPQQPTRATPAPATSQHDRDVARAGSAPSSARRRTGQLAAIWTVRTRVAAAIWMIAVVAAISLCLGALLVALDANTDNVLVSTVLDVDRAIDGPFWKVFDFYKETKSGAQGAPDEVKNHLVNWGLAAAGYLIVGRFLNRLIRPASR